jgi:hypothetical protein
MGGIASATFRRGKNRSAAKFAAIRIESRRER